MSKFYANIDMLLVVGEKIQPVMQQLCVSMLNELVSRGLYSSLEVISPFPR